ncbi:MAG: lytic transglycosylase domain-containing protein [Candidatus Bipolaricaulota bacterium]
MRRLSRRVVFVGLAACSVLFLGAMAFRVLYPIAHVDLVVREASLRGLDPALVMAVIRAESRFRSDARSARGALGLMQLMEETACAVAADLGTPIQDLLDPETNVRLGTEYLRDMLDRFGDVSTALMAYNAGPTRVAEWRKTGEAPFSETAAYVRRVLRALPAYRAYLRLPFLYKLTPPLVISR